MQNSRQRTINRIDGRDVMFVVGLLLLAAGLVFVYWPLALIVPGVVLVLAAVLGAVR